jgi:ubiquinone/menaquinone biosynthesis C-methylase UbiE
MTDDAPEPANDALAYHLAELEVARTPGDPRRVMPEWPAGARAVLDVGCGAGQTLIGLDAPGGDVLRCGVDVDAAALALGRTLDPALVLACARGESLPFADAQFDFVMCRVALPYMDVTLAAREMARVLKPGGRVWLVLHPTRTALLALAKHATRGQPRGALFQLYVLLNGMALHLGARQFRFPLGARAWESVQTERGIERALAGAGFGQVKARRDRFFVVTAAKGA